MRGTVRKISMPRRLVADLMHASMRVPFVSLRRTLDIRPLVEARAASAQRPGWAAIFAKAFCLVARDEPVLRTLYVKWPWPHFYELPRSVGMVAIARKEDGEDCVLPQKVTAADELPLAEVDALIRHAKTAAIDDVPAFRKILRATRLPLPLRRLVWLAGFNIRPPARQLFRQFRDHLGRRLRRGRASCAEPGAVYRQLRRGGTGPDHRCGDPLGSPGDRCGVDRQGADPARAGAEQCDSGGIAEPPAGPGTKSGPRGRDLILRACRIAEKARFWPPNPGAFI